MERFDDSNYSTLCKTVREKRERRRTSVEGTRERQLAGAITMGGSLDGGEEGEGEGSEEVEGTEGGSVEGELELEVELGCWMVAEGTEEREKE